MTTTPHRLPPHPDLVLRLAFVGNRTLPDDAGTRSRLEATLLDLYAWIAERLTDLTQSSDAAAQDGTPTIARFYSTPPLVRLISGLAEGADDLAMKTLSAAAVQHPGVHFESAGVLAFPHDAYRASREPSFLSRFDELVRACTYTVELDGIHDNVKDSPRRQRAYRAQTTVLLRQADLLIAMMDASGKGKPGGTQEAVREALAFGLPVVLIDTASVTTRIIGADEDADDVLTRGQPAPSAVALRIRLREWISTVLADPDVRPMNRSEEEHFARQDYDAQLLDEFFHHAAIPPMKRTKRQRLWNYFEARFAPDQTRTAKVLIERYGLREPPTKEPPLERERRLAQEAPYQVFRTRASALTGYYSGLYRGAFLMNFGLAAVAVGLAALSLVVLAMTGASFDESAAAVMNPWLFGLGLAKLAILVIILRNTAEAKNKQWNERAVDYRYLAERLRTMFYLPRAGGFQLVPVAPGYSARIVRQSAADWLFDTIVRHVSPRAVEGASAGEPVVFRPDSRDAVRQVRDRWLFGQAEYHQNNADKMHAMFTAMEHAGRWLNIVVIVAVCLDLLIVLAGLFHKAPHWLHAVTPVLVFFAALLPVTVAAINGIRFQSECQRLAERSRAMVEIIAGRWKQADELCAQVEQARSDPATDPGSWTPAALRLGESIAIDMMNETAEWSVLYGKEIVET